MKQSDVISICSLVAGVCGILGALVLTTVTSVQMSLHPGAAVVVPPWAIISSAVVGAVGTFAAQLIRILTNKTDAPATAITSNAKVVLPTTTTVHDDTPVVAENAISPIPQKGP